MQKANMFII